MLRESGSSVTRFMKGMFATAAMTYERVFSIGEIRENKTLQWYFGASLLFFLLVFDEWLKTSVATTQSVARGTANCWPHFQNCTDFFFLPGMTENYGKSIFYMVLYAMMYLIVWCMWKQWWTRAHALMTALFLWEALVVFMFSYSINAPYFYYHLYLTAVLLFVPFKEYFLKIVFVVCYFVSATIKLDSTWILGTYFTSLQNGLPLIPKMVTPLFTNLVIFSQIVGCWFLLSKYRIRQRIALVFFTVFHLYSGLFVYYMYPSVALPPLLILFGLFYRYTPTPFALRAIAGWAIVAFICAFQILGFVVPAEERIMTLEGNRYGMFMFEANHQCIISQKVYSDPLTDTIQYQADMEVEAGTPCTDLYCVVQSKTTTQGGVRIRETTYESGSSLYRCDPYDWWTRIQHACALEGVQKVALVFEHSVNGGPFYRMINEPDMCALEYMPFVHNEWIKLPPEAPLVGYPVENKYRD